MAIERVEHFRCSDGLSFITEEEAKRHEEIFCKEKDKRKEIAERFHEIWPKIDETLLVNENDDFLFFKVQNKEEFCVLKRHLFLAGTEPELYPAIMLADSLQLLEMNKNAINSFKEAIK